MDSKKKQSKKPNFQLSNNDYIQNALEKALVEIQYWQNWREMLGRLCHDLTKGYYNVNGPVKDAIDLIYMEIHKQENEAWKHSFMWALGQSETTRQKILKKAKERFLVSDRPGTHFEIMSHLDPRFLMNEANEKDFLKAIREYFELKDEKIEDINDNDDSNKK